MSQSARVHSLDALKDLHAALTCLGPEGQEALGAAEIEIRRVFEFLEDQLKYWRRQVEKRQEDVNRARADLAHARALRQGERSGYVEQEITLNKARHRLREAEEKVVVVKRWLLHLPQAVSEYEGPARRLAGLLDADLKQGLAMLDRKIAVLEAYMAVSVAEPPSQQTPPGGTS
jgi:chromosome segregation ATPase